MIVLPLIIDWAYYKDLACADQKKTLLFRLFLVSVQIEKKDFLTLFLVSAYKLSNTSGVA